MNNLITQFVQIVREAAEKIRREAPSDPEKSFREVVDPKLPEILSAWGVELSVSKERCTITNRRIDMLCGRIVLEYKAPGILARDSDFEQALYQTQDYMESLAQEFVEPLSEYYGIVLDGYHIGFVHNDAELGWLRSEKLEFNDSSAVAALERFRAHSKSPLDPLLISKAFGPNSNAARAMMPALFRSLEAPKPKTTLLLAEWKRLFGQAVGSEAHQYPGLVDWAVGLGIKFEVNDPESIPKLFFATHSYFALVIKLITAEIVETLRSKNISLLAQQLIESDKTSRAKILGAIEDNSLFRQYGILNFLEGDFFSWYVDHYDDEIDHGIVELSSALARFEPATPILSPCHVTDLFKKLYQYLVPEDIRHDLGEFYTPDWLADYVLQRVGFAENPTARLIDPACGSGTFLVRALRLLKTTNSVDKDGHRIDLIDHTRNKNIVGFDLNPLAVVSARANLILALVDELRQGTKELSLPIYLADSIYVPVLEDGCYIYRLETEKGTVEMKFPEELVKGPHFNAILQEVERYMAEYDDKPAPTDLPSTSLVSKHGLNDFYRQIWELDEQDWNKIWCRVIHNRFASVMVGKYDFVVGNPPWVKWSSLPASYRDAVKPVCDHYNLFSDDSWVGGIESDISTVLTYAAADRWLNPNGRLGFVITQSVFKTKSAQGFRRFRLKDGSHLGVLQVDDMVSLKPFEDAANRTAVLFLQRGKETEYPVPYLIWKRRSKRDKIPVDASLGCIMRRVQIWPYEATPIEPDGGAWLTAPTGHSAIFLQLLGGEGIHARKGTTSDFNNIYWVSTSAAKDGCVLVENNLSTVGHQVEKISTKLEEEIVFPLARGQEIKRFRVADPTTAIILPQIGMRGFDEHVMRTKYPRALEYFRQYESSACSGCRAGSNCRRGLKNRSSFSNPKYGAGMGEYWAIWNVGSYTFSPYKVAWKEVSSSFEAAVLSTATMDGLNKKIHVPDHKLMFLPCEHEDEAHYYCGVLNSELIKTFAEAISLSTSRGTRIFENLNIPKFDQSDSAHLRIASLSKNAHGGTILDEEFEAELNFAVAEALGHALRLGDLPQLESWKDSLVEQLRSDIEFDSRIEVQGGDSLLEKLTFVAVDIETTGFSPSKFSDRILEIGATKFNLGGIVESWSSLTWPSCPISPGAYATHGVGLDDLHDAPLFADIIKPFTSFIGESIVVFHNAPFDFPFLRLQLAEHGLAWQPIIIDTLQLLRQHFSLPSNRLKDAIAALGIHGDACHAALSDANATAHLFLRILSLLRERTEIIDLNRLLRVQHHLELRREAAVCTDSAIDPLVGHEVSLSYNRTGNVSKYEGRLVAKALGEQRGYLTLESKSGRRILLNRNRVEAVVGL